MKQQKHTAIGIAAAVGMLVLIFDARTALTGAKEGVDLCLYTVIPSLFPFIVLSVLINSSLADSFHALLRPVATLCGIPSGSEALLFLGLLGGYPIGAQSISLAYRSGQLTKNEAQRLLGFCSNAGPAFIFGMVGSLFSSTAAAWTIWLTQIISALAVGVMLPTLEKGCSTSNAAEKASITDALIHGIRATAIICGWVILFRILIAFASRWFLWRLAPVHQSLLTGILELTNGCVSLDQIPSEGLRYILSSCFLSLGGFCIWLQTVSVTQNLSTGTYCRGKLMQCLISFVLASLMQYLHFVPEETIIIPPALIIAAVFGTILLSGRISFKKGMAFSRQLVYNKGKL